MDGVWGGILGHGGCGGWRETHTETERQTDRQKQRERERQTETETEIDRQRQRQRETDRQTDRQRDGGREDEHVCLFVYVCALKRTRKTSRSCFDIPLNIL